MSNWRNSNNEERRISNAWNFNPTVPASAQNNNSMNNSVNETNEKPSGDYDHSSGITAKNPWNQSIYMRYDVDDGEKSEDYTISSSLKTIWSDVPGDSRSTSSNRSADASCSNSTAAILNYFRQPCFQRPQPVQQTNNVVIPVGNFMQPTNIFGQGSSTANNLNLNALKGRAITSRSSSYVDIGNVSQIYSPPMLNPVPNQQKQIEDFLEKVQIIVNNGFLNPNILKQPISPDTFDLVQMLIFYVMEYSKTKTIADIINTPEVYAEIQKIFYKINLIQNEINKCQLQYVQQRRMEQEIMQTLSAIEAPPRSPSNQILNASNNQIFNASNNQIFNASNNQIFNASNNPIFNVPTFASVVSNQIRLPALSANDKTSQIANGNSIPRHTYAMACSNVENYQRPNERFRQLDQFAQQPNVNSSGKFTFLPKTKNIERSPLNEQNIIFPRRDGNFSPNKK